MLLLVLALAPAGLAVAGCGGDDAGDKAADTGERPASGSESAHEEEEAPGGCLDVVEPEARPEGGQKKPRAELDPAKTYEVTMKTTCGSFTIRLDVKTSPETTASFASLVRKGFYDGTSFHRIVPGFVIQGGDPTGSGTGGPGYSVRDVPPIDTTYTTGVVAMAKRADEPRGMAGSQFFVMTANATLPPDFAVLGKVTSGLDVVKRIGRLGNPANEQPTRRIVVRRMTITP
jgi:cyclophilin family peptidyl-prolyl cis-trans isomerase